MSVQKINVNNQENNIEHPIDIKDSELFDFELSDDNGASILILNNGNISTKNFNSSNVGIIKNDDETVDFSISDTNDYRIVCFKDGHIKTKKFNSESISAINNKLTAINQQTQNIDERLQIVENNIPSNSYAQDKSSTNSFINVFEDYFIEQNSDWTSTSWSLNTENHSFSPTDYNKIAYINKKYYCDKREIKVRMILYNNSVFKIYSQNSQESSLFIFDINSKKILIYDQVRGNLTIDLDISNMQIVDGRCYEIIILISNFNTTISVIDTVGNSSISVEHFGRDGYELKGNLSFVQTAGSFISLKSVRISILENPTLLFVGDSITAGAYFTNSNPSEDRFVYHVYTKLLGNEIGNSCTLSVGGGGMTQFEEMWTNELQYMHPKAICALVGTNGGFTQQRIETLIRNFISKTNIVAVNHLFGDGVRYQLTQYNVILETVLAESEFSSVMSARFDICTSTQKSENTQNNTTLDTTLMYDGVIHPNYAGSKAMIQRLKLDCPKLFRLN